MRVGFITLDWSDIRDDQDHPTPGGAGWYRMVMPAQALAKYGKIETFYGPQCGQKASGEILMVSWDGESHDNLDIIVFQRWMENHGAEAIRRARAYGQVIINDVDDWMDGLSTANNAYYATHPRRPDRFAAQSNINHYRANLTASSALTVSTEYLQSRYQAKYPDLPVYLVRNAIDLDRWPVRDVTDDPVIGWVGATMFRSRDLETVGTWIKQVLTKHPEGRFHHSGWARHYPTAGEVMKLPRSIPVTTMPMSGIHRYPNLFSAFNVGIVPLSDTPFNYAKSAIKGMEYAASGIPFVAAPTPEYCWAHDQWGLGLVAYKPRFWLRHLERLMDPGERAALGGQARRQVAHLDVSERWADWLGPYTDLTHAGR